MVLLYFPRNKKKLGAKMFRNMMNIYTNNNLFIILFEQPDFTNKASTNYI